MTLIDKTVSCPYTTDFDIIYIINIEVLVSYSTLVYNNSLTLITPALKLERVLFLHQFLHHFYA